MKVLHKILLATCCIAICAAALLSASLIHAHALGEREPIQALLNDGQTGMSYTINSFERDGNLTLYLPAYLDKSSLSIFYAGKVWDVDAKSGKATVDGQSFNVMTGGRISTVCIELEGGDNAFRKICLDKNNTASGTISVIDETGGVLYSGGLEKMKGHGLTSFIPAADTERKNSYNIKLENKAELVDGSGRIKKWVLLSPRQYDGGRDSTGLSQLFAFRTYNDLVGDDYCNVCGEYVDLYINGEYRGVYILCERMNRGGAVDVVDLESSVSDGNGFQTIRASRNIEDSTIERGVTQYTYTKNAKLVDTAETVDITGGYVLEVMHEAYEDCGFITARGIPFHIKSPEVCTKKMVQYIAEYVQGFEDAIYSETGFNSEGKHYTDYADMQSLCDMILIYAFYENFEFFRTSTYLYKDADGQPHDKLTFGPVWDFETSSYDLYDESFFGTGSWFTYFVYQQYAWCEALWQHGDFVAGLYRESERMRDSFDRVIAGIESDVENVGNSQKMSIHRWLSPEYSNSADAYIEAVRNRVSVWYGNIWSSDKLLGIEITPTDNGDGTLTLTAEVLGTKSGGLTWYKVKDGDMTKYTLFNNHSDAITVPADGGRYFCTVTGINNAYLEYADSAFFSNQNVTMRSITLTADPELYRAPETDPPTSEAEPSDTEEVKSDGCGSTLDAGFAFAAVFAVCGAAFAMKKRRVI